MDAELAKKIIFWTITVFIAGLIGYFGRYLAMMIIDTFKKKKKSDSFPNTSLEKEGEKPVVQDQNIELKKEKLKLEKKKAKVEHKLQKKLNKD